MKLIHCIGPRKVDTAKKLKIEVPKMLKNVISMVNFVKIRLLKLVEFLLFSVIRWGMTMEMFYSVEVWCLSWGNAFSVIQLKDGCVVFSFYKKDSCFKFTHFIYEQVVLNGLLPGGYFLKNFYWSIVALQCCVSFCCTATWINYTYIPSFLDFLPI